MSMVKKLSTNTIAYQVIILSTCNTNIPAGSANTGLMSRADGKTGANQINFESVKCGFSTTKNLKLQSSGGAILQFPIFAVIKDFLQKKKQLTYNAKF